MSETRLHREPAADERGAYRRFWERALGERGDPPLARPRCPRVDPIHRSWLLAFWQARIGVQAGTTLDDFLRSRLARYLATLPVPRSRLPLAVGVEDGQLEIRATPPGPTAPPRDDGDAWLAPLVAVEGPPARREVVELELKIATLDGEIDAARRRVDERGRQFAADVAVGLVAGPPEVDATAEQLGRPPIRSGAPRVAAMTFGVAALSAETWQIALPILGAAGVDPSALGAEVGRRPAEVGFAAVFALAVATGLFALAHAGLGAAVALFRGDADERRRRWLASAALATVGAATLVAIAVATVRASSGGPHLPGPALVLLLLAVPLAASLVERAVRGQVEARGAELDAALAWDRERARALGERIRRLEEIEWAQDETRALETRRDAARRRLREVNARAIEAARLAAEAERREREDLARLGQSLVAALELDRYEFVRQASARGAHELLAPPRRKSPEPPAATPTPVREQVLEATAGRLAS